MGVVCVQSAISIRGMRLNRVCESQQSDESQQKDESESDESDKSESDESESDDGRGVCAVGDELHHPHAVDQADGAVRCAHHSTI